MSSVKVFRVMGSDLGRFYDYGLAAFAVAQGGPGLTRFGCSASPSCKGPGPSMQLAGSH